MCYLYTCAKAHSKQYIGPHARWAIVKKYICAPLATVGNICMHHELKYYCYELQPLEILRLNSMPSGHTN